MSPKILILDIETSPNLVYVWGLFNQNISISQVEEAGEVICWAAKWAGKKQRMFKSIHHDGKEDMVQTMYDLLEEADIVVHFNGKSFDMKHLNREFLLAGLNPPAPYAQVDLLLVARQNFKFLSNKMDFVVQALGLGAKVHHTGFDMWLKCMAGDAKAWALMKKYNLGDILVTEALYNRLGPWITNHPTVGLYSGLVDSCPSCGSGSLQMRGYSYTKMSTFQRFVCNDCGKWSRSNKRETASNIVSL